MLSTKLKATAGNSADATLYVNDVFSTYLYTGTGATQTITNGIDLAGKGGLVWTKSRSAAYNNALQDTVRGRNNILFSNDTVANQAYSTSINSFNANGYTLGSETLTNQNGTTYVGWTFRKAAKFFDVVTYTGTGSARTIAHSLGVAPGMMMIKRTDSTGDWITYQISRGASSPLNYLVLNTTAGSSSSSTIWNNTLPTSSVFTVGTDANVNASGGTYVAYLFAQDTSSTGIIQSGSYNGTGTTATTITLGWEPQFILIKRISDVGNWYMFDSMRGLTVVGSPDGMLQPNTTVAETTGSDWVAPFATGFNVTSGSAELNSNISSYIYMAIRRPNKPPTTGTQVYNAIARTGTGAAATVTGVGFASDLVQISQRPLGSGKNWIWFDRLRGGAQMVSSDNTGAEFTNSVVIQSDSLSTTMDGFRIQTANPVNSASYTYINYSLKRAPGFFDEVCYTGVGAADVKYHNLNAIPELMIVKNRSNAYDWYVFATTANQQLVLNSSAASQGAIKGGGGYSSTTFKWVDTSLVVNGNTMTYVAYLFATLAGISKVGSYTGNGTGQAIACGFSAGARFVLIKRTDSTGGWYTFDSARGLTSGSSPYLLLNSTAAEVTGNNGVYASTGGFTLGSTASTTTNINGASYIYLSVA